MAFGTIGTILVIAIVLLVIFLRQVDQYERGVLFTMGRYSRTINPGWRLVIPLFQSLKKVDIRTKAVDVPDQEAITRDNIPVHINAVIYYKIVDTAKAVLEIENYYYATSQLAQTTMRNMVGEYTLDQLLQDRHTVADKIKTAVDGMTDDWGIDVLSVELKDVVLPESLKRTIAKVAEAEREKKSVIISSEGELAAAENVSRAAAMLSAQPGALHLRTLQSINDISSDQSNTTVWMVPVEALKALEGLGEYFKNKK
ncbi:MAG TPA: slipin family protein [bacterium]|nr:slipin family protein [bacterium]